MQRRLPPFGRGGLSETPRDSSLSRSSGSRSGRQGAPPCANRPFESRSSLRASRETAAVAPAALHLFPGDPCAASAAGRTVSAPQAPFLVGRPCRRSQSCPPETANRRLFTDCPPSWQSQVFIRQYWNMFSEKPLSESTAPPKDYQRDSGISLCRRQYLSRFLICFITVSLSHPLSGAGQISGFGIALQSPFIPRGGSMRFDQPVFDVFTCYLNQNNSTPKAKNVFMVYRHFLK